MNTKLRKRQLKNVLGFKKIPVKTLANHKLKKRDFIYLTRQIMQPAKKKKKKLLKSNYRDYNDQEKLANTKVKREFHFQSYHIIILNVWCPTTKNQQKNQKAYKETGTNDPSKE